MLVATPRSLRTAVDAGSFDPVYVLFGDEEYIKEEVLRLLLARAVDAAMRDFNVDIRRGPELDAAGLQNVKIIAPECSNVDGDAFDYVNALIGNPTALGSLRHESARRSHVRQAADFR